MQLPAGIVVHDLTPHRDDRGIFTELYRTSWKLGVEPVQWNCVRSRANVLRGVHVHWRHADYLTLVEGRATVGLHDLRPQSNTAGLSATIVLTSDAPQAIVLPVGVAHGFYFHEPSIHVYSVTHDWDPEDELGCRWDDPSLEISWPCSTPLLSERDRQLGTLAEVRAQWKLAQGAGSDGR